MFLRILGFVVLLGLLGAIVVYGRRLYKND